MLAYLYIPWLSNDMKIAVQKNDLQGQHLYRSLYAFKKNGVSSITAILVGLFYRLALMYWLCLLVKNFRISFWEFLTICIPDLICLIKSINFSVLPYCFFSSIFFLRGSSAEIVNIIRPVTKSASIYRTEDFYQNKTKKNGKKIRSI